MNKNQSKYFNTAMLMDEALLKILEKKDFEFISVKEICLKAGVNRSTFYLHYENTNDLLIETVEYINKKFQSEFNNSNIQPNTDTLFISDEYLIPYLNFVKKNLKIFRLIHNKPETFGVNKAFKKMYKNFFEPALNYFGIKETDKDYIFEFYSKGCLAIIMKWVDNDCKDEISDIINLIVKCVKPN